MSTPNEIKKLSGEKYTPYNFSSTQCHIVKLNVQKTGTVKIEEKLPIEVKQLKGVFISANIQTQAKSVGFITLTFNEGQTNPVQYAVINTNFLKNASHPLPLDEVIKPNSLMQGYFRLDETDATLPMTLTIYLHYTSESKTGEDPKDPPPPKEA